ncbi:hypothetical protein [Streptomyces mobaraensis]|uniref:Bulb-type lectin domain-containing protein n=1 Tax=Streptomyces mobaraensis TaxID=35621 RepID=A0A5N5VYX3_STRMB|nr:hypothetical protein [Streptomyces mobaraensis]KAB7832702.1 hypothetical protein FRZ00_34535 [Streptomyces mobaraensis]
MKKRVSALLAATALMTLTLAGQASALSAADNAADGVRDTSAVRIKATQILQAPAVLERGQSWSSDTATLVMQTDGNLVVYDEFGRARWNTGTVNQGWQAVFQTDGNFVVYTRSGKAVWDSKTAGHPGSRLAVQDDGNVVIYDGSQAIWNTRTAH